MDPHDSQPTVTASPEETTHAALHSVAIAAAQAAKAAQSLVSALITKIRVLRDQDLIEMGDTAELLKSAAEAARFLEVTAHQAQERFEQYR